jgi:hypothetical protein
MLRISVDKYTMRAAAVFTGTSARAVRAAPYEQVGWFDTELDTESW